MTFSNVIQRTLAIGGVGMASLACYRYQVVKQLESSLPTKEFWRFPSEPVKGRKQQVVVIGGGVVGVTTAHQLAKAGHSVVLIETKAAPAEECSACAAGGMQRSNPAVDRDSWIAVMKCLNPLAKEGFKFFHINWLETISDPFFLRWLITFTRTSLFSGPLQIQKQTEMLKFTNYAIDSMKQMLVKDKRLSQACGYNPTGSLSVSYKLIEEESDQPTFSESKNPIGKATLEPYNKVKGYQELLEIEPSLKFQNQLPTGAKMEFEASAASAERFTKELAVRCVRDKHLDVTFLYNTQVKAIKISNASDGNSKPWISMLQTNQGVVPLSQGSHVVVAAGAWTPHVLSLLELYAPVYPLKGYAMSVSAQEALRLLKLTDKELPSRIVCDQYMFTSRLGDEIRVTSIGEFSGWATLPTPSVLPAFRYEAIRQFPQLQPLMECAPVKCGHRPYVSDGILLLGRMDTHQNLYVSCGPGSNGWKLAVGSGNVITRLVSGQSEKEISEELGFQVETFSPAGRVLASPFFSKLCRARWNI